MLQYQPHSKLLLLPVLTSAQAITLALLMLVVKEDPVTFTLAFADIITLPIEEVKLDPVTSATVTTASTSPIAEQLMRVPVRLH
jgi:hypothetical protein